MRVGVGLRFMKGFKCSNGAVSLLCRCHYRIIMLYEHLPSASSRDEPQALHNGKYSAAISFGADPLRSSSVHATLRGL